MKILAIECSAGPVSVAVSENGRILSEMYANIRLTHSQTLLPMVTQALSNAKTDMSDISHIAVAAGPGSFTGIRIGISAVKGLAMSRDIPCIPVSTLRAMAEPFKNRSCIVCAVMDARCSQVYNALFEINGAAVKRLCPDRALMCSELAEELKEYSGNPELPVIITGDGTDLFSPFTDGLANIFPAAEAMRFQRAAGVCLAAEELAENSAVAPDDLLPVYLRLPQAERELKRKEAERNTL